MSKKKQQTEAAEPAVTIDVVAPVAERPHYHFWSEDYALDTCMACPKMTTGRAEGYKGQPFPLCPEHREELLAAAEKDAANPMPQWTNLRLAGVKPHE